MATMMAACGVLCSKCPAYRARAKGPAHQKRTADAWRRIYGLEVAPGEISCGGCQGPDEELFCTSRSCKARGCCRGRGFGTCAECGSLSCGDLEHAQSVWDGVPELMSTLSRSDFATYAQPYCNHRRRLAAARARLERGR